jgi:ribose transport system substrate-binding protein
VLISGGAVRRRFATIIAAFVVVAVAAGCGSSSSSSSTTAAVSTGSQTTASSGSTSSTASATPPALAAAEAVPTSIGITTPLAKKPPTGKTIVFLRCSTAVCGGYISGLLPAAKALGWTIKSIPFVQTPEGIQAGVEQAIQAKPSGIYYTGIDNSLVKQQLAQAAADNIPIVNADVPDVPGGAVKAIIQGNAGTSAGSIMPAEWIAANGGGDTLVVNIPTYPILVTGTNAFIGELKKLCSSCQTTVLNQQVTDVGTALPAAVVSALQRNPNIKNVAFAFGDMTLGVLPAIKAAGLSGIRLVNYGASSPSEVVATSQGQLAASLAWSLPYSSWRALDTLARYFEGQSTTIDTTAPVPQMLLTQQNAASEVPKPASSFAFAAPAGYQAAFLKLWHVS